MVEQSAEEKKKWEESVQIGQSGSFQKGYFTRQEIDLFINIVP